ncbi:enoyl-CoA hydratase/isomerase family protein [Microbulbifer hydrolyticus]|uniref:3-hydroxyisobutyryl-CoA hydrolase n=1 Tax=Microbulbifer hydrolyticus TaxID=48074 RepID=A0A6P1T7Y9_9GAMM|nr:enoyl-CoA hydratase/isomerase family protein [Microbulbifer hydrolyticus]MBB5211057.1 enoyl-CoA hydratase/carnithine racemase [Microbulbifer hydrolyticus]QHQ38147.1 enoyl-CoA hydratase/isomerase family protein [Microbulbifer hydrolyticus]
MTQESPLIVERQGPIGKLTLNLPKAHNALNLEMIDLMAAQLDEWEADDSIACIWIEGAGDKALCAGGDVVALHKASGSYTEQGAGQFVEDFFTREYRLDYRIHTYPKPVVVWGSGIVMGGGIGIMSGASHRIVTETTRMAMPEITIGLFPDVGGSWFLNRMPGRTGLFLGLTGAQFNGTDALYCGMADRLLPAAGKDDLLAGLAALALTDDANQNHVLVSKAIQSRELPAADQPAPNLRTHYDVIQELTDGATLPEVYATIANYSGDDKWLQRASATMLAGCPLTAWIVWEQLRRARHMSLADVLRMELALAVNMCNNGQVKEGVRALLIDKDRNPQWQPATLAEVSRDDVEGCFSMPWAQSPLADLK